MDAEVGVVMHTQKFPGIIFLILTLLLAGCGGDSGHVGATEVETPEPTINEPGKEEKLAKLETELATVKGDLTALIGQAQCTSSLDCRLLGLSPNGCTDSYDFYAAYSVRETNEENLFALYAQMGQLGRELSVLKYAILKESPVCSADPMPVECMLNPAFQVCPAVMPSGSPPSAACINNQCRDVSLEEQLAKLKAELATVDADIKALIGQAQCTSSLDCRLLDVESLPICGGLSPFYAAYSVIETDQEALLRIYEQRKQLNGEISSLKTSLDTSPVVSPSYPSDEFATCQAMSLDPVAQCVNNQCKGVYGRIFDISPVGTVDQPSVVYGSFLDETVNAAITSDQISAMIGDPVCSSPEQCGVWNVAYSSVACGEPAAFAYSSFATDPQQIAEKVGQYAQHVAAEYNAQGLNAVCQPSVSFANGVCRNDKCEPN